MRLKGKQLEALKERYGVDRLWSWSKWNSFHNSPYEYYLKYIAHVKEDRADAIYTTTGGIAHDILEQFYTDQIKYEDMEDAFQDGWVTAFDITGLKFDRNDEEKNKKIADKYYYNLSHFFASHTKMPNKPMIEQFVCALINGYLFQGYIDAFFKDDAGNYTIVDFKTSSIYKGAKAENECGQLIVYAIALNQRGVPLDKIKICWNFLKYVSIQYCQANGQVKTREVERCKIGESLQSNAKMWLKKLGYADQLDDYLKQLQDTNTIACLPEDVQAKYVISDCYVYVDVTDELIDTWTKRITAAIKDIENREKEYELAKANGADELECSKAFWDTPESVEANSFYFATLCSYSPALHLPYKEYLDKMEAEKDPGNVFGGVAGADYTVKKGKNQSDDGLDLSWLNEL